MKKQVLSAVCTALTVLSLTGCKEQSPEPQPEGAVISVDFSAVSDPVYRMDIEYFLDGELIGGMACSHADETPMIGKTEFVLTEAEFPAESKRENFTFYLVISGDASGINKMFSEASLIAHTEESSAFTAEFGRTYAYSVTGSYKDGFVLHAAG